MATFDVRDEVGLIDKIVFWEGFGSYADVVVQYGSDGVSIYDKKGEYVVVKDKKHALYLIKALEKTIELKWLT